MTLKEILEHCGFKTPFEFIYHHFTQDELFDALEYYVNNDNSGELYDSIKEIAEENYDFVDYEALEDDKNDAKYDEHRDKRNE